MEDSMVCPVTVIVPVYQSRRFLSRCIESVLAQTFPFFELLLIDDGSIDGSGEICDQYARRDRRICVIHQANLGVSAARNEGLRRARGEYLYFLDSDDFLAPRLLDDTLPAMKQERADTVVFNACQVKNGMGARPFGWTLEEGHPYTDASARDAGLCHLFSEVWRKAYRRSLWDGLFFPETLTRYEDMPVSTEIWCRSKKAVILPGSPGYFYERAPHGSLLQTAGGDDAWQAYAVWKENIRILRFYGKEDRFLPLYELRRKEAAAHALLADQGGNGLSRKQREELTGLLSISSGTPIIKKELHFLEFRYAWMANCMTAGMVGDGYGIVNQRRLRSAVRFYGADEAAGVLSQQEKEKLRRSLADQLSRKTSRRGCRRSDILLGQCIRYGMGWILRRKGERLLRR